MRFRSGIVQTVFAVVLVALFIHLGNWQGGKVQRQREMQALHDARGRGAPVDVTNIKLDASTDQYRRVGMRGRYLAEYQILLDNQIDEGRAGYHVLTAWRLADTGDLVYVDRGWIPAPANRADVPVVPPPVEIDRVVGDLIAPPRPRWLAAPPASDAPWPKLWQSFELEAIQARVPNRIAPLIVRLDPKEPGGFERHWPRFDSRVDMHQSYAYQWYGLTALVVVLYLFAGLRAGAMESRQTEVKAGETLR